MSIRGRRRPPHEKALKRRTVMHDTTELPGLVAAAIAVAGTVLRPGD
jgi:hypothetical protein